MKLSRKTLDFVALVLLALSIVLVALSFKEARITGDTAREARKLTRIVEKRVARLDGYIQKALEGERGEWMDLGSLPSDMAVYRYYSDTLQSWAGSFGVSNDRLGIQQGLPTIANPRRQILSPLSEITDSISLVCLGQKWYLARSAVESDCRVLAGIEIIDVASFGMGNGVNPKLHLRDEYEIRSLSDGGGSAVTLGGKPLFVVVCEGVQTRSNGADVGLFWLSLFFVVGAAFVFMYASKTLRRMFIALALMGAVLICFYFWGMSIRGRFTVFSPFLYSDNAILYSLGAVVIINIAVLVASSCVFVVREDISRYLRSKRSKILALLSALVSVVLIILYSHTTLRSIILNSSFSLGISNLSALSWFSVVIYVSFLTMLMSVPLLLQAVSPLVGDLMHWRYNALSINSRILFAILISVYLVASSAIIDFRREQDKMELLANRLSFDRDVNLEMRLKRVEGMIAGDMVISALSQLNNSAITIQNRVSDFYLSRVDQSYNISAYVFNSSSNTKAAQTQYSNLLKGAVPVSDDSRFMYVKRDVAHSYYVGVFVYVAGDGSTSRVLLRLDTREVETNKGYASIFGITPAGKVTLPVGYSYARYDGPNLKAYSGRYAYSTSLHSQKHRERYGRQSGHYLSGGYVHFVTMVGDTEAVVISRERTNVLLYVVSLIVIALATFFMMGLITLGEGRERAFEKSYYKTRIVSLLFGSLFLTLVMLASISVFFVYTRNEDNMRLSMSDKITSITTMLQSGLGSSQSLQGINMTDLRRLLRQVGDDTGTDITIFNPSGRVLLSTASMVYERELLGERMDGRAYGKINYDHLRYYIQKEKVGPVSFQSMYAPVINNDGEMMAIICSPYNEDIYDFEQDAITHTVAVIAIFLVFLFVSLFLVSRVVDKMFKPLGEMSRKMNVTGLENLEHIDYSPDDEISVIVQAYNRMVDELKANSKKLAQAERDKAWSEMARQVAHEIKNPLTPMKLQIQRVIRLKQKGDPNWQTRFDEASKVLLDHIDILTDTANEFSTFAKLYTEEPVQIALDVLLQEEITMFDNKENIHFEYLGLHDVKIHGPKPQLTRVFVNLINNAVQALGEQEDGRITVSLRLSRHEGYYDIVFEDNGPGVSEENVQHLFTPNFTTKNGGSGLGLAISRSILETSGASISYSRSFTLGGACFTIVYPRG